MTGNNTFLFHPYHLFGQVDCSVIIMLSAQLRCLNFSCNKTFEYIHLRIQIRLSQNSLAYYSFSQFKKKKSSRHFTARSICGRDVQLMHQSLGFSFFFFLYPHVLLSLNCFLCSVYVWPLLPFRSIRVDGGGGRDPQTSRAGSSVCW